MSQAGAKPRKKSIPLEWAGGLVQSSSSDANALPVSIKGQSGGKAQEATTKHPSTKHPSTKHPSTKHPSTKQDNGSQRELSGGASLPTGRMRLRRETKGRGGRTVLVLFDFACHPSESSLRQLASVLKQRLACGGGFDSGTIVLQYEDVTKIIHILKDLGLTGVQSGG